MNYKNLILILLLTATYGFVNAQQPNRKGIEWMLKEKIKIDPEFALKQIMQGGGEAPDAFPESSKKHTDVPLVSSTNIDAEVHAAVNPLDTQNILASPIRQTTMSIQTPIFYTKDFGGTWSKSSFNPMPSFPGAYPIGGGDPVLAFDENGRAYFSWLELHIRNMSTDTIYWGLYWAYSDDGGENWIRPQGSTVAFSKLVTATGSSDNPVTDKQWLAVDRSNTIWRNNLYMSYVEIDIENTNYQVVVNTKPVDSLVFNPVAVPVTDSTFTLCQFASLDVDIYGHVHVSFFGTKNNMDYGLYHSRSTDGGNTFSTPVLVSNIQFPRFSQGQLNESIVGINNDRLYPSCYMKASPTTPHIYVTWTANGVTSKLNEGLDIYFSSSSDGGATWSPAKVVNDDQSIFGAHQYYSSISCGPDGNVILGWYDRRDDTANVMAHYYFTESFDFGNTFSPSYQVTTAGTDFSKVGMSNNEFGIGEYTQILGLKDYIIPVWTDGRTNNGNLNIYVAFINRKTMSIEQLSGVNNNLGVSGIYPNPATDRITASISLREATQIESIIFDQSGRIISEIRPENYASGEHKISYMLDNYANGIYYLMIRAGEESFTRRVVISR